MGHWYPEIPDDPKLVEWILNQVIFHVASAPLSVDGKVNVSPKGQPSFKLVNNKACWYVDMTGSGNETISHIYEPGNARVTIMFQAFQGPAQIVRFFGKGRVFERDTPEFDNILKHSHYLPDPSDPQIPHNYEFDSSIPEILPGTRAIIWLDIEKVGVSCGYSVPFMKFERHRDQLNQNLGAREKRESELEDPFQLTSAKGLKSYWVEKNSWSIDGLPGLSKYEGRVHPEIVYEKMKEYGLEEEAKKAGYTSSGPKNSVEIRDATDVKLESGLIKLEAGEAAIRTNKLTTDKAWIEELRRTVILLLLGALIGAGTMRILNVTEHGLAQSAVGA